MHILNDSLMYIVYNNSIALTIITAALIASLVEYTKDQPSGAPYNITVSKRWAVSGNLGDGFLKVYRE